MVATIGLIGSRPSPTHVGEATAPPYDVVKEGTPLHRRLMAEPRSLAHVTLGPDPAAAFARLHEEGAFIADDEPAYYVYEQRWGEGERRVGVFAGVAVTDYSKKEIIRHEKTFDEKVKGRLALARAIEHTVGPVFLLTRAALGPIFAEVTEGGLDPVYDFTSDFGGGTDLHGIHNRVFRIPAEHALGEALAAALAPGPLYIADGHHRYHAALKNGQSHTLAYITEEARILAYDRVVNGKRPFAEVRQTLEVESTPRFETPQKRSFCIYTREGTYLLRAKEVPDDVVGRLDCAILERELYPHLGLTHAEIVDPNHFDYYPESALDEMKAAVDAGRYELAIALAPVEIDELMAVADAGLENPDIVMPEKSTFFSPKILSGLFLFRH